MPHVMIGLAVPFATVLHGWPKFQTLTAKEKHLKFESNVTASWPGSPPCLSSVQQLPAVFFHRDTFFLCNKLGGNVLLGGHRTLSVRMGLQLSEVTWRHQKQMANEGL